MNEQKKSIGRGTTAAGQAAGGDFVRGVITELRRVTWPTRDEWVSATVLTIGLVVGIGLFTWALDWLFGQLFQLIHPVNL
ncbi:MAG: preprotein translocase subunit SecE [Candidatus Eremiobacteraeota bacterium]|nr:preprotein translocase subunit SecE [Candidatus Eremiobacteraeota bacterium]